MSNNYTPHNFEKNDILTAKALNEIDNQIVANTESLNEIDSKIEKFTGEVNNKLGQYDTTIGGIDIKVDNSIKDALTEYKVEIDKNITVISNRQDEVDNELQLYKDKVDGYDAQITANKNNIDQLLQYKPDGSGGIGTPGVSIYKSVVYTRSNEKPNTPTGGTFESPVPNENNWSDSISNNNEEIVWASTRIFTSDGAGHQQEIWSAPAKMTNTASIEIQYSSMENPGTPNSAPGFWKTISDDNTIWMATRTVSNGVGGSWAVTKIKGNNGADGKDGKDGKDGTSIRVAGSFESIEDLKNEFPDGPNNPEDAYVVGFNIYVWIDGKWTDCGQFTGKDGKQVYFHIKYANSVTYDESGNITSVMFTGTSQDGESVGPWMGVYSDYEETASMDFTKYKWFRVDAEESVRTVLKDYSITSNLIKGKTMSSTSESELINGTVYRTFNEDGSNKDTIVVGDNTPKNGPTWQIHNDGKGYLASGNIQWDGDGNVKFGPGVKLDWDNITGDNKPSGDNTGGYTKEEAQEDIATQITSNGILTNVIRGKAIQSATNVIATEIKTPVDVYLYDEDGKSLYNGEPVNVKPQQNTPIPIWQLHDGGKGYLASGNIQWDEAGNVTFGPNVKLKWSSVIDNNGNQMVIPEGYTEEEIKNWATEITSNSLKTFKIDAANITGDTISGKTIMSTKQNAWRLENNGAGVLANGNILWDEKGNVKFGSGVKLDWNNVANTPNINEFDQAVLEGAVRTQISGLGIKANLIEGKTLQSTTEGTLVDGTNYYLYNDNGVGAPFTSNGTGIGPMWQIHHDGQGYFSNGNFRWDIDGNVSVNGNIITVPGSIIGPWKFDVASTSITGKVTCIHDSKDTPANAINSFYSNGTFRLGGAKGINRISYNNGVQANKVYNDIFIGGYKEKTGIGSKRTYEPTTGLKISEQGNVTFGPDVKLNWSKPKYNLEDGLVTINNTNAVNKLEDVITTISNNQISTAKIYANQIETDGLILNSLDTKPTDNNNKIRIEGNDILISNSEGNITCKLTNDKINVDNIDNLFNGSSITTNITKYVNKDNFISFTAPEGEDGGTIDQILVNKYNLGEFSKETELNISGKFHLYQMRHSGNGPENPRYNNNGDYNMSLSNLQLKVDIYENNTLCKTFYVNKSGSVSFSESIANSVNISINNIKHTLTAKSNCYCTITLTGMWTTGSSVGEAAFICNDQQLELYGTYTTPGNSSSSCIYENGAIFTNSSGGIGITKDGAIMVSGKSKIIMKNNKIYMAFNNSTTPKPIVPKTYKFHVDGKDQELTVLTFE